MGDLPADYEGIVRQIIRPTGLLDPVIELRPTLPESFPVFKHHLKERGYTDMPAYKQETWNDAQIPDLMKEIRKSILENNRVLVTTLTKKMAEELSEYLTENNISAKYLHSDIDTVERVEILTDLRRGKYNVIVGINLLREGLDLPEVALVAILDADKEGFLRSDTSLIQTMGRAARHQEGRVIMYCDKITDSMQRAIEETVNRRKVQEEFNKANGITPESIQKEIKDQLERLKTDDEDELMSGEEKDLRKKAEGYLAMTKKDKTKFKKELKFRMMVYADMMEFEKAAEVRDILRGIEGK